MAHKRAPRAERRGSPAGVVIDVSPGSRSEPYIAIEIHRGHEPQRAYRRQLPGGGVLHYDLWIVPNPGSGGDEIHLGGVLIVEGASLQIACFNMVEGASAAYAAWCLRYLLTLRKAD